MANRANVMKLMQEIRAFAEVTNRRPILSARNAAWAVNRPPVLHAIPPRIRRSIPVRLTEPENVPAPVKIVHLACTSPEPQGIPVQVVHTAP